MHFSTSVIPILAFASPVPHAEASSDLVARASKTGHTCTGDFDGTPYAVLACVDIKWVSKTKITAVLSVRDSKADKNDVYGYYRVCWYDGTCKDYTQQRNSHGAGSTTTSSSKTWEKKGVNIKSVEARACVDDAGPNTCIHGDALDWGVKENAVASIRF
ncbi:hypothetical protein AC579_6608 [Pseudocercospora musae]|uniref:Ecp2 effector protein domain-containing protein n=1 Tax=Pseudocercospora musae TaxID=113226 RepID=A0A139I6A7_9PEZI|nr:hypothetical protein AC579_6608 [Pseudocercospora musae]